MYIFLLENDIDLWQNLDYVEATSIYKMIEKLQTKLFHPFSINLMRTREAILKVTHHLWVIYFLNAF